MLSGKLEQYPRITISISLDYMLANGGDSTEERQTERKTMFSMHSEFQFLTCGYVIITQGWSSDMHADNS